MTSDRENLQHIPAAAVERFVKIADRVEMEAGEVFIREGDFEESIYLIESGQVEVERGGKTVGTIEAGDVVGEMAFIDRRPRTATVQTCCACVLLRVDRPDLLRELSNDPDLMMEFVHAIERPLFCPFRGLPKESIPRLYLQACSYFIIPEGSRLGSEDAG